MASNGINPVGRITVAMANQVKAAQAPKTEAEKPKPAPVKSSSPVEGAPGSTKLMFRVDEKTNDVTIMIVDKASDKIIRTIPPEAIKDLPSGELLSYST